MGIVKFNDILSTDLGLVVQVKPTYNSPEREYSSLHIPGRNGDLIIDNGCYLNVDKTYSFAKVFRKGEKFVESANSIMSWLNSANGYARLEDSYEPDYYRLALYKQGGEMTNYYDQATVLDVTFECKPQRWLKSGDIEISIQNGMELYNPTNYDALPIIKFTTIPGINSVITIGDVILELTNFSNETEITIDCENMECYSKDTLHNSSLLLRSGKFPVLKKETKITFENVNNLTIQPRWWTL